MTTTRTTTLITGANRGIGLELARQLKGRGDDVIACCRSASNELDALGVRIIQQVDVTDEASVTRLDEALGDTQLHCVINNAGILRRETLKSLKFDSIRAQLETNSIGPLRVTGQLLHRVVDGGKVAVVTSRMGSIADNDSGGAYGYRMSKAAVNAAFRSLALDLRPRQIAVAILHPGWVRTEMTGNTGLVDAAEAAAGLIARIDGVNPSNSGTFWHMNGEELPW